MILDGEFWEEKWRLRKTGWDIGYPSPPLKRIIESITDKNAQILIPGSGNAYEAEFLVDKGFNNITLIDISPTAVELVRQKFKDFPQVKILLKDFFKLEGQFDYVLEQTFFCALDRRLRSHYVKKMHSILMEGGVLTGVLFSVEFNKDGPPFGGSVIEYRNLFSEYFENIEIIDENESIKPRLGSEVFFRLEKRG